MTEMRIPKEEFDAIYARVPRLNVELIAYTPKGLLLTKRDIEPCKGMWHIPGGTVFFGESLKEALSRIAKGELGMAAEAGKLIGFIEYPQMAADGYKGWPVGIAFETKLKGGPKPGIEGEEIGYFTEVPPNTIPDQEKFLNRFVFKS